MKLINKIRFCIVLFSLLIPTFSHAATGVLLGTWKNLNGKGIDQKVYLDGNRVQIQQSATSYKIIHITMKTNDTCNVISTGANTFLAGSVSPQIAITCGQYVNIINDALSRSDSFTLPRSTNPLSWETDPSNPNSLRCTFLTGSIVDQDGDGGKELTFNCANREMYIINYTTNDIKKYNTPYNSCITLSNGFTDLDGLLGAETAFNCVNSFYVYNYYKNTGKNLSVPSGDRSLFQNGFYDTDGNAGKEIIYFTYNLSTDTRTVYIYHHATQKTSTYKLPTGATLLSVENNEGTPGDEILFLSQGLRFAIQDSKSRTYRIN